MPTSNRKKVASPAQLAANRRNCRNSTGPRTAEGKARSRANAVKHGLTGAGVALPGEDATAVAERILIVQEELAPATLLGAELAHDLALLIVRKRRCARAEAAHLQSRARRAESEFDRARAEQADRLVEAIEAQPRAYRRALLAMPEGVERLAEGLATLRDELLGPVPVWTEAHHRRVDALFGFRVGDLPCGRPTRFSRALIGDFGAIGRFEVERLADADERWAWAAVRLIEAIDAEIARVRAHGEALDRAAIELDRAAAADCALGDVGRDAEMARRYGSAAGRDFARTLRDFIAVEALAPEPTDEADDAPVAPADPEPAVEPPNPVLLAPEPELEAVPAAEESRLGPDPASDRRGARGASTADVAPGQGPIDGSRVETRPTATSAPIVRATEPEAESGPEIAAPVAPEPCDAGAPATAEATDPEPKPLTGNEMGTGLASFGAAASPAPRRPPLTGVAFTPPSLGRPPASSA